MTEVNEAFLHYLSQFVTEHKKVLIEEVLSKRTRHFTVVLEDIYQAQNASAVIRTCDCYGIQDIHIIEDRNEYNVNPRVVHGAAKWINIQHYNEVEHSASACLTALKSKGYKLVATSPDPEVKSIYEMDVTPKTAIVFGTEKHGISDYMREHVDELVTIPMYGFTESLNISVSAAICISSLVERLLSLDVSWHLTEEEKQELRLEWYKSVVDRSEILEREFFKR